MLYCNEIKKPNTWRLDYVSELRETEKKNVKPQVWKSMRVFCCCYIFLTGGSLKQAEAKNFTENTCLSSVKERDDFNQ